MKIAKISYCNLENRKGLANNIIERNKYLIKEYSNADCYNIQRSVSLSARLIKGKSLSKNYTLKYTTIDNIRFENIWITIGIMDYLISHKLNLRVVQSKKQLKKHLNKFRQYDLISTHGIEAGFLAMLINEEFGIPYVATWHGSDINVRSFESAFIKHQVKKILDNASYNFFVSQKLLETSLKISKSENKGVLYTGPAKYFIQHSESYKNHLKEKLGINTKYIIGYIGNFVPIKNVMRLPDIFNSIGSEIKDVSFILVGDGSLDKKLRSQFKKTGMNNIYFLGNKNPNEMPDIMGCLDLLVLPSINEGLPRVILEALSSGVPVIGSNRGGITEVLSTDNTFELNSNFVENISRRAVEILTTNDINVELPKKFSWEQAIEKELEVYENALS